MTSRAARSASRRSALSRAGSSAKCRASAAGVLADEQVPVGENASRVAAVRAKALDGCIVDLASALNYVQKGEGKILLRFGDLVQDFIIHVIFATDKAIAEK